MLELILKKTAWDNQRMDREPNTTINLWIGKRTYGFNINDIEYIQANGDELELILSSFKNLPYSNQPVVKWYGDMAKFIMANIEL